jgi:hypothetical protein
VLATSDADDFLIFPAACRINQGENTGNIWMTEIRDPN